MKKISIIKVKLNRFDRKDNFFLWQARGKDVLIQHGLIDVLLYDEMPATIEMKDWKRIQIQAVSTICLYLADDVVIHVFDETFLMVQWLKLEE